MVLAYILDETAPRGLESLCVRHLGVKGWKDEFEAPLGSEEFALYNARDVIYTLKLYRKLLELLGDRKSVVDTILRPAHIALSKMSERGIHINTKAVARERVNAEALKSSSLATIMSLVEDPEFNPGSSKQVGEWIECNCVILPVTDTGKPKTDTKTLADYVKHPAIGEFCTEILSYRKSVKTLGTYVEVYEKIATEKDGRVHPTYSITRTKTGRSAASNTNVQNLSRAYKDFFGAPPGKMLWECDWSSVEFRIAAWAAQEETILARYAADPDWDAHRFFSAIFYGKEEKDVTKAERQIAKSVNFSQLYCGHAQTIQNYAKGMEIDLELGVCQRLHDTWHQVFPGFRKFYREVEREILTTGNAVTATGFTRHFGDIKLMPKNIQMGAVREGVNVKVQGFAAHIAYLAMQDIEALKLPAVYFVHDSFGFEFSSKMELEKLAPVVENIMTKKVVERLRTYFGVDLNVPLTVEGKIICDNT